MAKLPEDYEKYASPFSTAFGGTAASTELDAARQYASPFSTAFGGTAPTTELDVARQYASPFSTAFGGTAPTFESEVPVSTDTTVVTDETVVTDDTANKNKTGYSTGQDGELLLNGKPFNGNYNGKTYINGWDQSKYNPDGTDRTSKKTTSAADDLLLAQQKAAQEEANRRDRQSAYDILYNEFNKYGLGSLVEDIKYLLQSNVSPSQFAIELQNTKAYQQRFSANQDRIKAGLRSLTPAEYVGLEDQYQNIMRNYGLPTTYYTKDATGKQSGFDKFLAGDVSASELEDRIATAQQRVLNSNPEVLTALKQFYPDISNADILAYTLDPQNALTNIKRKVTAAEIGGAALSQGLQAQGGTAESLAGQGITKAQAQQGYSEIAGLLPRASQLSDIYGQDGYTQGTAEAEIFNTAGAAEAKKKRQKLTALEQAAFSGSSGVGALGRDKAIYGGASGQAGLY
jgi:hypothetical protein